MVCGQPWQHIKETPHQQISEAWWCMCVIPNMQNA
jgi:hypothetical protein